MSKRTVVRGALVLAVFVVAFVPRVIYPISRPAQWYTRSIQFIHDVGSGAWEDTVYSEHPGVTTMWLSGLALRLAGVTPEMRAGGPYVDPASLTAREAAIGVFPLALTIALLISLTFGLLLRLFSPLAALGAALLVALDPFLLANSKVLHVDGLLAMFAVTSALALLVYRQEGRARWLALSGALGGLALLTKSPALFLLPYTALSIAVGVLFERAIGWRRGIVAWIAWLAVVCLTYFALYPAMWVDPLGSLQTIYSRAALRISWAHPSPIYFLGQPVSGDPGPVYYLVVWACKLTAVATVFTVVAAIYAAIGREFSRSERRSLGLLLAFSLFFTLQMTIGAKKLPRYLLPAFPALDIVAGVGLAWYATRLPSWARRSRAAPAAFVSAALLLQGALVLPRHPYYGTHFSELVGARTGIWALSTQWEGEGLDIAAKWLNRRPRAEHSTVGSAMPTLFGQYYVGETVGVDEPADWYVFGINQLMRDEGTDVGAVYDFYRRRKPLMTVGFGQASYASVYPVAKGPQNWVSYRFGAGIELIGCDIASPPYLPGETVRLQLYWRAIGPVSEDYTVFLHLLDQSGRLIAQQDNQPVQGLVPTSGWERGVTIVDPYDLVLPEGTSSGESTLTVGLYRLLDGYRVPAYDVQVRRLPDDRAVLEAFAVEPEPLQPAVWAARALAVVVLASAICILNRRSP